MEKPGHTKKEPEATLVIQDAGESAKDKSSGSHSSRLLGDVPKGISPVELEADSSLDFRRALEISGKRYMESIYSEPQATSIREA